MYHIPEDRRAQRSAQQLTEGLLQALEGKELYQVTVTDLWRISGVGRATFYRLFDTIPDILAYACDCMVQETNARIFDAPTLSVRDIHLLAIQVGLDHADILEAVLHSRRMDLIHQAIRIHSDTLRERLRTLADLSPQQTDRIVRILCSMIPVLFEFWIKGGKQDTPEQLYGCLQETISQLDHIYHDL